MHFKFSIYAKKKKKNFPLPPSRFRNNLCKDDSALFSTDLQVPPWCQTSPRLAPKYVLEKISTFQPEGGSGLLLI
jgi:hypothetical protein